MKEVALGLFTILFVGLFGGSMSVCGQDRSLSQLGQTRITMHEENEPLWSVLATLTVKYKIPIGLEESLLDRDHDEYELISNIPSLGVNGRDVVSSGTNRVESHFFTIDADNEKLEKVLDMIVAQMKNYDWEINDDVVNIYPIKGRDKRLSEFLDLRIKKFTLKERSYIFLIRTKLFELPEVTGFLADNNLNFSDMRGDLNFLERRIDAKFEFSNLTMRELLNRITKIKKGGWTLKWSDVAGSKEKEFLEIEI